MSKQPAVVSYFFGEGYSDVAGALKMSWDTALKPCKNEVKRISEFFKRKNFLIAILSTVFDLVVFLFMTLIGIAVSCVISAVLLTFFALAMSVIYILFMILKSIDYLYCVGRRLSSKCPKCQMKFMYPVYLCPSCGANHDKLVPSKYGIMKRRCLCGKKIPTSFINGRHKLTAICPYCRNTKSAVVEKNSRDICCVPVIGGRYSGKTCFISSSIAALEDKFRANGWYFEHLYGINDEYEENIKGIRNGVCPLPTSSMRLKYYRFAVKRKKNSIKNIITLCDIGGNAYSQGKYTQDVTDQVGFSYADGLLMVIDPLSIAEFRQELSSQSIKKYKPSENTVDDVLTIVEDTLNNMFNLGYTGKIKTRLAVVFTKCDMPELDDMIGATAIKRYKAANPRESIEEIQNKLCIQFLQKYNEHNFLNSLSSVFKEVRFFTSSPLGHCPDGQKFAPSGVAEPVLWLLAENNFKVNLK